MANILWVEDEAAKISGLIRPLIKHGHNVEIASDKSSAIDLLSKNEYDLVLLDIIIPDATSDNPEEIYPYEGVNVLKASHETINIDTPVVVLSVVNDSNVIRKIEKLGAVKRLSKGALLPSKLLKCINSILGVDGD